MLTTHLQLCGCAVVESEGRRQQQQPMVGLGCQQLRHYVTFKGGTSNWVLPKGGNIWERQNYQNLMVYKIARNHNILEYFTLKFTMNNLRQGSFPDKHPTGNPAKSAHSHQPMLRG